MALRLFVSYVYEDGARYAHQLRDWARQGVLGDVEIVTEREDFRQFGDSYVQRELREIMNNCHAGAVLVGNDTHNRPWVDFEIDQFLGAGKQIFWVRLPDTSGAAPPRLRHLSSVAYSPRSLRAAFGT